MRRLAVLLSVAALPAFAQDQAQVETAYQTAISICLLGYPDPASLSNGFRANGFEVSRDEIGDLAEGAGVLVYFEPVVGGGCNIQTNALTAKRSETIGRAVAAHYFAGQIQEGAPEGAALCPTISIFAPRDLMVMEFLDAGNGGDCSGAGGASISLRY